MWSRARVLGVSVLALVLGSWSCTTGGGGGGTGGRVDSGPAVVMSTSYEEFPLEGGYEPGTILVRFGPGNLSSPIATPADIVSYGTAPGVLTSANIGPLPETEVDRSSQLKNEIKARAPVKGIKVEAANALDRATSVKLRIDRGMRVGLRAGTVAIERLWESLPKSELARVVRALGENGQAIMVTEVSRYDSARLEVKWRTRVDGSVAAELPKLFTASVTPSFVDTTTLVVKYNQPILVGYKYARINRRFLDSLTRVAANNRLFRDADGDGYGDPKVAIWSDAPVTGFVQLGTDCYDNNPNAHPKQTRYFAQHRGDGHYDYDCDGAVTRRWMTRGTCGRHPQCDNGKVLGWEGAVPEAGQQGSYLDDCDFKLTSCKAETSNRVQEGR